MPQYNSDIVRTKDNGFDKNNRINPNTANYQNNLDRFNSEYGILNFIQKKSDSLIRSRIYQTINTQDNKTPSELLTENSKKRESDQFITSEKLQNVRNSQKDQQFERNPNSMVNDSVISIVDPNTLALDYWTPPYLLNKNPNSMVSDSVISIRMNPNTIALNYWIPPYQSNQNTNCNHSCYKIDKNNSQNTFDRKIKKITICNYNLQ